MSSYYLKYHCDFFDYYSRLVRVRIYNREPLTSTLRPITLGATPVTISQENANNDLFVNVQSRICKLEILATTNSEFDEFITEDTTKYRIDVQVSYNVNSSTLVFRGFINGELCEKSYTRTKYVFNITAIDPLCMMKNIRYRDDNGIYYGFDNFTNVVNKCLQKTPLKSYNINESISLKETNMLSGDTYSPLDQCVLDQEFFLGNQVDKQLYNRIGSRPSGYSQTTWKPVYEPDTCYEVLEKILKQFDSAISYYDGDYWIERRANTYSEDTYLYRILTTERVLTTNPPIRVTGSVDNRYTPITTQTADYQTIPINHSVNITTINPLRKVLTTSPFEDFITNRFKKSLIEGDYTLTGDRFEIIQTYAIRSGGRNGMYTFRQNPNYQNPNSTLIVNLYTVYNQLLPFGSGNVRAENTTLDRATGEVYTGPSRQVRYVDLTEDNIRLRLKLKTYGGRTRFYLQAFDGSDRIWLTNTGDGWVTNKTVWAFTDDMMDIDELVSLPVFSEKLSLSCWFECGGTQFDIYDEFSIDIEKAACESLEYSQEINTNATTEKSIRLPFLEEVSAQNVAEKAVVRYYRNWILLYKSSIGVYIAAADWDGKTLAELINDEHSRLYIRQRFKISGNFLSKKTPFQRIRTGKRLFFITNFQYNVKKCIWNMTLEQVGNREDYILMEDEIDYIEFETGGTFIELE